jgi:hypothetical protein
LNEKQLLPLCGLPVCVVMKDGTRHFGVLTSCRDGKLVLNGQPEEDSPLPSRRAKKRGQRPRKRLDVQGKGRTGLSMPKEPFMPPLSLGPIEPIAGPRIVLPLKPIETVLIM